MRERDQQRETNVEADHMLALMMRPREIIVQGPHVWGRGATVSEALLKAREAASRVDFDYWVWSVPPGAWVNEMGGLEWLIPEGVDREEYEGAHKILEVKGGRVVVERKRKAGV